MAFCDCLTPWEKGVSLCTYFGNVSNDLFEIMYMDKVLLCRSINITRNVSFFFFLPVSF